MKAIKSVLIGVCVVCAFKLFAQPCSNSEQVVLIKGVECLLPQLISTGEILLPCMAPMGFNDLIEGDTVWIQYQNSSCFSICLQGKAIDIFCFEFDKQTSMFPTLNKENLNLVYSNGQLIFNKIVDDTISIIDTSGQILFTYKLMGSKLNLPVFSTGLYFITFDKTKSTVKFFVNN